MWLDNLKELKKQKNVSAKQIADGTNLPERTVARIFSGDTDNPYVDTLFRIVTFLGGSLDEILTDSKAVVASKDMLTMQETIDRLTAELDGMNTELVMLTNENNINKDKVAVLSAENDLLKLKLEHKEEIIALQKELIAEHHFYAQHKEG